MEKKFKCCAKDSPEAKNINQVYLFLRAISDPNRLKILCFLRSGPKCVCKIFPAIGISDKLASHHLKQLKKIGVLKEKREGNFVYYSLKKAALQEYKKIFNQIIR